VASSNLNLEDQQKQEISTFLEKFRQGQVCVHPTDTIPGLTCDPKNDRALQNLEQIKKRTQKKSFVSLVPSFEHALGFWQPLPELWLRLIARIWPGPVTFVWKARTNLPRCLVSERGEIALRFPQLGPSADWFLKVMKQLDCPIPSTSINCEGEIPLVGGKELEEFCKTNGIYLAKFIPSSGASIPSSVIRILSDENFEFLRIGSFSKEDFLKIYTSLKK
jgi:L-threonylcarbamoyladenylate synthase